MTAFPITPACNREIEATLSDLPPLSELRDAWLDLESRSRPCFYTSWAWIGTWLELLPEEVRPQLLQARIAGRVVGLAVVVQGPPRKRYGLKICHSAHLHATGRPELDTICIEHNDFLLDREQEPLVRVAMLAHWLDHLPRPTEVSLTWLTGTGWPQGVECAACSRIERTDEVYPSYAINLEAVRNAGGNYLGLIGKYTRRQIRRSLNAYSVLGEITVDAASSVGQALDWLDRLAVLHQARWRGRGQPGCFSNEFFVRFHRSLITRHLMDGSVQLLRVRVGGHDMAYLYSLVRDKHVYGYQTGLNFGLLEKNDRPGMVGHMMAFQYNASIGNNVYDLMAGTLRYKDELSTLPGHMTCTRMRTNSWRFGLEAALPHIRRILRPVRTAIRRTRAALWRKRQKPAIPLDAAASSLRQTG